MPGLYCGFTRKQKIDFILVIHVSQQYQERSALGL